jgi:hypothetical protein
MPEPIRLDYDLENALAKHIDREIALGRFDLSHDRTLVLDSHSGEPGTSELAKELEAKLGKYIDFHSGGLKLLELDVGGKPARFTLNPGWQSGPEMGKRSMGGPSLTLKFTITW